VGGRAGDGAPDGRNRTERVERRGGRRARGAGPVDPPLIAACRDRRGGVVLLPGARSGTQERYQLGGRRTLEQHSFTFKTASCCVRRSSTSYLNETLVSASGRTERLEFLGDALGSSSRTSCTASTPMSMKVSSQNCAPGSCGAIRWRVRRRSWALKEALQLGRGETRRAGANGRRTWRARTKRSLGPCSWMGAGRASVVRQGDAEGRVHGVAPKGAVRSEVAAAGGHPVALAEYAFASW
jgi:hypothetical protein